MEYTSTASVRYWKEHQCCQCAAAYSYNFLRKIEGNGSTPEEARKAMLSTVETTVAEDTDLQPCPSCGTYQPDMIGQRRAKLHWLVLWILVVAIGVLLTKCFYGFIKTETPQAIGRARERERVGHGS